jgi:hypothetical protein
MTTYATELGAVSRYPNTLCIATLDRCANTCGSSPCTATGTKCWNTYFTCKDKAHFSKTTMDYEYTSVKSPLPFPGPRPYIDDVKYIPTEIKDNLTISGRVNITLRDEPELTDIGLDPYYSTRSTIQGTYAKKLVARNPNYKGRPVKIYNGFYGLAKGDFVQRFDGIIDNITIKRGGWVIEVADLLKKLADIDIPAKSTIKLAAAIDATQVQLSLTDATDLDASNGYVRIGDEIIFYLLKTGNQLSGCIRGCFSTTAEAHNQNDKVQKCRYYAPQSAYDILTTMLQTDAGIAAGSIDSTAFALWKAFDADMPYFSAIISEPIKLSKLFFEIIDLIDCKCWVGEDLKITIRKNLPNYPGRTYQTFTDADNIIANSISVDLNAKSRVSRISIYWNKTAIGKDDEISSYNCLDVFTDVEGEGANLYNESVEKKVYCRWLRLDYMDEDLVIAYMRRVGARMLRLCKNPLPIITFDVELKDSGVKTGDMVKITTSALCEADGSDVTNAVFQIVRREEKGNRISLKAQKFPKQKIFFIQSAAGAVDYTSATDAQKEYGFICSATTKQMSNGDEGYYLY